MVQWWSLVLKIVQRQSQVSREAKSNLLQIRFPLAMVIFESPCVHLTLRAIGARRGARRRGVPTFLATVRCSMTLRPRTSTVEVETTTYFFDLRTRGPSSVTAFVSSESNVFFGRIFLQP